MDAKERILSRNYSTELTQVISTAKKNRIVKNIVRLSGLIIFGILLSMPMLVNSFPVIGHDTNIHLAWYTRFADQLWSGEFYPRWLMDLNAGYGDAVFFFYGPLPYYLTSILHPFFPNDQFGWYQMGISSSIALIFSGLFAYIWLKRMTSSNAAFAGACIYMLLPYHLGYDLYIRAAFGEYFAFIWMPLILYFVQGIIENRRYSLIGLAFSYAALVLTHLSTTLIFSIIPLLYALFLTEKKSRFRSVRKTIAGMTLGLGLSAIYLLPALSLQKYVSIDYERNRWLYQQSYLFMNAKYVPELIIKVSIMVFSTVVLAALGVIISLNTQNEWGKRTRSFWVIVGLISIFMMTPLSEPVVEIMPVIQLIQFPSRFNTVFSVAVAGLFSIGTFALLRSKNRWRSILFVFSIMIAIGWVLSTLWTGWQQSTADKALTNQIVTRGIVTDEYWPKWVQVEADDIAQSALTSNRVSAIKGNADIRILEWTPREILLRVDAPDVASLELQHFYFPGWKVCTQNDLCLNAQPITPMGIMTFDAPSGRSDLSIRLYAGIEEITGLWITAGAITLTIILMILNIVRGRQFGNKLSV